MYPEIFGVRPELTATFFLAGAASVSWASRPN
uniref:Uncharacterized protein n=1 Tax=Anguilla anguilla TaxID=7936 RepID=A0A0E9TJG3_ANGAN